MNKNALSKERLCEPNNSDASVQASAPNNTIHYFKEAQLKFFPHASWKVQQIKEEGSQFLNEKDVKSSIFPRSFLGLIKDRIFSKKIAKIQDHYLHYKIFIGHLLLS